VKTLPCIAVFMSSLTIVVIAIDRYLVICRPAQRQVSIRKEQISFHLSSCSKTAASGQISFYLTVLLTDRSASGKNRYLFI
jgi:hypothetical protein